MTATAALAIEAIRRDAHVTQVVEVPDGRAVNYSQVCSCGWESAQLVGRPDPVWQCPIQRELQASARRRAAREGQ